MADTSQPDHDVTADLLFLPFAQYVVDRHGDKLCDYGPDEQTAFVMQAMRRIAKVTAFAPVSDLDVDLAGFGTAPIVFTTEHDDYLLLSDIAEALGWPLHKADAWARTQYGYAISDQRDHDEERGDGRLGWECLLDYIDLRLNLVEDAPDAKPDANGRRWEHSGDWLISKDRMPALLMSSPWSKEFMDNSLPAFGHAMREIWGDKLKEMPVVGPDGEPMGNAYDDFFTTDGLTKEEAQRRARRGPAVDG